MSIQDDDELDRALDRVWALMNQEKLTNEDNTELDFLVGEIEAYEVRFVITEEGRVVKRYFKGEPVGDVLPSCRVCGGQSEQWEGEDSWLCNPCAVKLYPFTPDDLCTDCGLPLGRWANYSAELKGVCGDCYDEHLGMPASLRERPRPQS